MHAEWIHSERQRALDLLAPAYTGVAVDAIDPDPPPEQLGALTGFGLVVRQSGLHLSVYVFEDWGQAHEQARAVEATPRGDGSAVRTTVNGALLLVGVAREESPEASEVLARLGSAFAGWE
jgi:hypothetical protein